MGAQTAASEFLMPPLGADMDEGTLVEWLVAPGDEVQRGHLAERDHVELSGVHGSDPGGAITRHDGEEAAHAQRTGHVRASPYARRLAEERGIDLQGRSGRGPGGAVVAADVPTEPGTGSGARGPDGDGRRGAHRQRAYAGPSPTG